MKTCTKKDKPLSLFMNFEVKINSDLYDTGYRYWKHKHCFWSK